MSEEQATGSASQEPVQQDGPSLAERVAELHADAPVAPAETAQVTPAAEPSIEAGTVAAAAADTSGTQDPTQFGTQAPAAREPEPAGEQQEPDSDTAAEDERSEGAPVEGFDPDKRVFVKQFNLASSAPLHELDADALAEHPQTAGLPDAAARAALDQGYKPSGPAVLVYGEPDGAKSALSFAVPVEPRPAPTPPSGPAPFQERPEPESESAAAGV